MQEVIAPYYAADRVTLHLGDCVEVMCQLPAASVDAIVTDPPYELGFMGKHWDGTGIAYSVEMWREALRVLKPGGHLAAFGGTRTYHRMACAIEDAGFEVRDTLQWLYGSGFPKSLDVSKAIDSQDAVAERQARALRFTEWVRSTGLTAARIDEITGTKMGNHYTTHLTQPAIAVASLFNMLRPHMPEPPEWVEAMVRERTIESENIKASGRQTETVGVSGSLSGAIVRVTERGTPQTDAAREWAGWGTALKPAYEPIVLARKPLAGTVAANVLRYGTGAINVDACRIGDSGGTAAEHTKHASVSTFGNGLNGGGHIDIGAGRWPANVLLDEEAAAILDAEVGEAGGGFGVRGGGGQTYGEHRTSQGDGREVGYGDRGGPSRFFYTAKASRSEREAGLETFEEARRSDGRATDIENPRLRTNARRNDHPTVKPVDLMRWLCRLVTPPGGTVLDPFNGSGTTGMAALDEGFTYIGIEREERYIEIARHRITHRHLIEVAPVEAKEEVPQGRLL